MTSASAISYTATSPSEWQSSLPFGISVPAVWRPNHLLKRFPSLPLGRMFRSADGNLDEAALNAAVSKAREAAGKTHDAGRWFTADDELIRYKGRTYTLTKMWGGEHWLSAMTSAKESYADQGISFSPSDGP